MRVCARLCGVRATSRLSFCAFVLLLLITLNPDEISPDCRRYKTTVQPEEKTGEKKQDSEDQPA